MIRAQRYAVALFAIGWALLAPAALYAEPMTPLAYLGLCCWLMALLLVLLIERRSTA